MSRLSLRLIAASLCLGLAVAAGAQDQRGQNMFKDVEQSHWSYPAVEALRSRSIVTGYPDGYFRGKRALTRYEFAVAVDRALKLARGAAAETGGGLIDPRLASRDVESLRKLAAEFKEELASLGSDEKSVGQSLEQMSRLVSEPHPSTLPGDTNSRSSSSRPAISLSGGNPITLTGSGALSSQPRDLSVNRGLGSAPRLPQLTLGRFAAGASSLVPRDDFPNNSLPRAARSSMVDGARFDLRAGGIGLQGFYGNLGVGDASDPALDGFRFGALNRPQGFSLFGGLDPAQAAGGRAIGVSGDVGFNLLDRSGRLRLSALTANMSPSRAGAGPDDVTVVGADSDIRLSKALTLSAEWARSIFGASRLNPAGSDDTSASNAFNAMLGYNSSRLSVSAGYRYVDPLFVTPGAWGRIGGWLNPTNIQGPTFRASYDLSPNLGLTVGGDFYTAARDNSPLGLDPNEDIRRALLGVRWGLTRSLNLTADYEGVFWNLNGSRGAGQGMFHPTEHYITLGTGYSLTGSTLLRFNYQIGEFDGHGGLNYGSGTRGKVNAFVGQVSVKF